VIPGQAIINVLPVGAIWMIFLGGVFYSIGVCFVASHRPVNHVIWHFLVLIASALHFLAIYLYILPSADA
jgi:hemolysin III